MINVCYQDPIYCPPGVPPDCFYPVRPLLHGRVLGWYEAGSDAPRMKVMGKRELASWNAVPVEPLTEQLDLFGDSATTTNLTQTQPEN